MYGLENNLFMRAMRMTILDMFHTKPKMSFLGLLSNLLGSMDCLAYLFLAPTLHHLFFPTYPLQIGIAYSFLLFAISRILRPIGGFLIDYYYPTLSQLRDMHAVKLCLLTSVPTLCLGLLPTHQSIGSIAPILLVVLTALHSITKALWMPVLRPVLFQIVPEMATVPFTMIGSFISGLFFLYLTPEAIQTWGWRLPFLVQIPLAVGIALLKHSSYVSPIEQPLQLNKASIAKAISKQKKSIIVGSIISSALVGSAYTLSLYLPLYLTDLNYKLSTILFINGLSLAGVNIVQYSYARLGHYYDRYFDGTSLTVVGLILGVAFTYPLVLMLQKTSLLYVGYILFSLHFLTRLLFHTHGILHVLFLQLTPNHSKQDISPHEHQISYWLNTILSLLPAIILGNMVPFICSYFINNKGFILFPAYYSIALNIVALITFLLFKGRKSPQ
jgi:MHS family proline/betaine transporter-like MFS transporter